MLRSLIIGLLSAMILSNGVFGGMYGVAHAENADSCLVIGGLGMPNFVPEEDGTVTIVAPLSGSVGAASGSIYAQRETETGLEMDMEHYFMSDDGGFIHTRDVGVLTRVEGRANQYMIEITYDIQEDTASGPMAGYDGTFKSYGLVDLDRMQGLVRYSGKVCR